MHHSRSLRRLIIDKLFRCQLYWLSRLLVLHSPPIVTSLKIYKLAASLVLCRILLCSHCTASCELSCLFMDISNAFNAERRWSWLFALHRSALQKLDQGWQNADLIDAGEQSSRWGRVTSSVHMFVPTCALVVFRLWCSLNCWQLSFSFSGPLQLHHYQFCTYWCLARACDSVIGCMHLPWSIGVRRGRECPAKLSPKPQSAPFAQL